MSITVLAGPPAQYLTTLARIKAELGIPGTADDDVLRDILERASSAISRYCNRPLGFGTVKVTETLKGTGSQLLGVTYVPLLSIAQILQDTEVLTPIDPTNPQTNQTEGYYIEDAEAGAIYRPEGWGQTVALMSWGWEAYASRYILPGGTLTQRYTVTYSAGYFLPGQELGALQDMAGGNDALYDPTAPADAPPLPGDVEEACLVTVKAWWFARRRDPAVTIDHTGNQRATYLPEEKMLPTRALGLLRDYRRSN